MGLQVNTLITVCPLDFVKWLKTLHPVPVIEQVSLVGKAPFFHDSGYFTWQLTCSNSPVRTATNASKPWYSAWMWTGGWSSCHMRMMMPKKLEMVGMNKFYALYFTVAPKLRVRSPSALGQFHPSCRSTCTAAAGRGVETGRLTGNAPMSCIACKTVAWGSPKFAPMAMNDVTLPAINCSGCHPRHQYTA